MSDIWQQLSAHRATTETTPLTDLFAKDADRFERYSVSVDDLLLDYSKTALDDTARALLMQLAEGADLASMH